MLRLHFRQAFGLQVLDNFLYLSMPLYHLLVMALGLHGGPSLHVLGKMAKDAIFLSELS